MYFDIGNHGYAIGQAENFKFSIPAFIRRFLANAATATLALAIELID